MFSRVGRTDASLGPPGALLAEPEEGGSLASQPPSRSCRGQPACRSRLLKGGGDVGAPRGSGGSLLRPPSARWAGVARRAERGRLSARRVRRRHGRRARRASRRCPGRRNAGKAARRAPGKLWSEGNAATEKGRNAKGGGSAAAGGHGHWLRARAGSGPAHARLRGGIVVREVARPDRRSETRGPGRAGAVVVRPSRLAILSRSSQFLRSSLLLHRRSPSFCPSTLATFLLSPYLCFNSSFSLLCNFAASAGLSHYKSLIFHVAQVWPFTLLP